MAESLEYLEYEEKSDGDDLFSDGELPDHFAQPDTRVPIVPSGASVVEATPASPPKPVQTPINTVKDKGRDTRRDDSRVTPDQRLHQLRTQRAGLGPPPDVGAPSLKMSCSLVVRHNSMRIYDIGGLAYSLIAPFVDQCGREQLAEIEENSPHIMKDTDWLWEFFVISEYPVFYETCRLRKGEPRTSGWRRMYEKGAIDAEARRLQAMERVANRYQQLEKERASKRIVVMDTLVAPKAKSGWGNSSYSVSSARRGPAAAASYNTQSKLATAMNKARSDSQRARVALTHASGKFGPPAPSVPQRGGSLHGDPHKTSGSTTFGSRLPAPRIPRPKGVLPEAYRTADGPPKVPLPVTMPQAQPLKSNEERFRIGRPASQPVPVPKKVPNPQSKPIGFFTGSPSGSASTPAKRPLRVERVPVKRPRVDQASDSPDDTSRATTPPKPLPRPQPQPSASSSQSRPLSQPASRPHPPARPPPPKRDLESVLFLKKRKPPPVRR